MPNLAEFIIIVMTVVIILFGSRLSSLGDGLGEILRSLFSRTESTDSVDKHN